MAKTRAQEPLDWLTLRDASQRLGVSPATLRHWADKGKIPSFRTPGGHRRFSLSATQSLTTGSVAPNPTRQLEMVIHGALGRARLEIAAGRLEHEPWNRHFDPTAREQHRKLGQRLMRLLLQALHKGDERNLLYEARRIGKEYARVNMRQRTSLADALRAFLFFRDYVFEGLIELSAEAGGQTGLDTLEAYRCLNRFINEMQVAMVTAFPKGKMTE